jgi:hypothetical protein
LQRHHCEVCAFRRASAQAEARAEPGEVVAHLRRALSLDTLTIGFARRFATYKRPNLLLHDPERQKLVFRHVEGPTKEKVMGLEIADTQGIESGERVRSELDAGADLANLVGLLEDRGPDALARERKGRRQSADAATDDQRLFRGDALFFHRRLPVQASASAARSKDNSTMTPAGSRTNICTSGPPSERCSR